MAQNDNVQPARRFAVVGAGPSGLYAVDRILRVDKLARVDVFDRVPVPFGLVRYGVAPDHQGTKSVARVLERALDKPGVRFLGNVEIGRDVTLEELRAAYDGVLLSVGVGRDKRLGIPGEDLGNVAGSWNFTAWVNGRPGYGAPVDLAGVRSVVIIGLGNVAIDVARLLLKTPDALAGSDVGADVSAALASASAEYVTIIGRGNADEARFGQGELAELVALPDVAVIANPSIVANDTSVAATVLRNAPATGRRTLAVRFGTTPLAVEGEGRATGLRVADATGEHVLPADLIVTCIGYGCTPLGDLPQDAGRFVHDDNRIADGLYVAGWAATGPRGTIASSRVVAQAAADRILAETVAKGGTGLTPVAATDLAGWRRIDAAETAGANEARCRTKFTSIETMLGVARGEESTDGTERDDTAHRGTA
jgi:ferredoxin--NADP+ reductase